MTFSINPFSLNTFLSEKDKSISITLASSASLPSLNFHARLSQITQHVRTAAQNNYSFINTCSFKSPSSIYPDSSASIQSLEELVKRLKRWVRQQESFTSTPTTIQFYQKIEESLNTTSTLLALKPLERSTTPNTDPQPSTSQPLVNPRKRWLSLGLEENTLEATPSTSYQTKKDKAIATTKDTPEGSSSPLSFGQKRKKIISASPIRISSSDSESPIRISSSDSDEDDDCIVTSSINPITIKKPLIEETLEIVRTEETLFSVKKTAAVNMKDWATRTHAIVADLLESVEFCVVGLNQKQEEIKALKLIHKKYQTYLTIKAFLIATLAYLGSIENSFDKTVAISMHTNLLDKTNEAIAYMEE